MARLLSINNYHYRRGGSDVVYLDHAELLVRYGWQNAFFSMHHPKNLPTEWSRYFVDEIEFGHSYSVADRLAKAAKVIHSFEAQRKLRALVREFRPEVAHLHCIYHHLSPAILPVLSEAGVPTVMTAHDLKIACPAYKMLNRSGVCERCKHGSVLNVVQHRCIRDSLAASVVVALESGLQRWRGLYRRHLARVVCPSAFFLEKFVEWGWPREQLCYIPNYVDERAFDPEFSAGRYALYFGRLAVEKGVDTLIEAAAMAGVPLRIAGAGPEEVDLRNLALRVGGDIEFLGFRSGPDLHRLIRQARFVVLPSQWYENAPMSVLESMALGKAVLGARIGGIPELIDEGRTGWLFESGSTEALTGALSIADKTTDKALEAMGRAARDMVSLRFTRQRYLDATLALYADLKVREAA